MLNVIHLKKSYDAPVLKGLTYTFPPKGLVTIRGSSGVGKTTLLRLLAGLEKPDEGEILWDKPSPKCSVVFQEARLLPHLTLKENVRIVKKVANEEEIERILKSLSLWEDRDKHPAEMSGGMRLRGAIARSLYYGGDVYLWDEPTKELDPENRERVYSLAQELAKETLVIVVTHDPLFSSHEELLLQ